MNEVKIRFNGQEYVVPYNEQTGYNEVILQAPSQKGGIYELSSEFTDIFNRKYAKTEQIQILEQEKIRSVGSKNFVWIFSSYDFSVKDIVEIYDYEISIDEETNANSIIKVLKKTAAKESDIVVFKKNADLVYWGIITQINNEDGKVANEYILKYITNMFDQKVILKEEELIKTTGIEDFIAKTITDNFINNEDRFLNKLYLKVIVKTHTKIQTTVSDVQDNIYNLHTFMNNCTQKYNIVYGFSVEGENLVITIKQKNKEKELIDVYAQAISNYSEVFETSVVAKVIVLTKSEGQYNLFLLNDRTTTTDMSNKNRAEGKTEIIYTEKMEEARQKALDVIKSNSYNHNITFNMANKYIPIGTPISIKTKNSIILDTYISALKMTPRKFIEYTCGNIRIKFLDKLLKERKN